MAEVSLPRAFGRSPSCSSHQGEVVPQFPDLMRRFLVAHAQLDLARQSFGDLAGMSNEHARAGLVVGETVRALDQLYNELDSWHVTHEHTATATPAGRFTDDGADRTPVPGLPPALSCPFCGRSDDIMISQTEATTSDHGEWYRAHCGICGVDAPGGGSIDDAATGWNTRAADLPCGSDRPISGGDA